MVMRKLEKSFSDSGVSHKCNMKKRITSNSDTKKDKEVFSKICADQDYGPSLYTILFDCKLCTNKYFQKFYPLNMKVKKFFNISLKGSTEYSHSSSNITKSKSFNSCVMDKSKKNTTLENKKKVTFDNSKKNDSMNSKLSNNLSLNTFTSKNLQSTEDTIKCQSTKMGRKFQTQITKANQSLQTDNEEEFDLSFTKVKNHNLSQPILSEYHSFTELDPEIDQFLRTVGGPFPLIPPTTLNDLKKDKKFCNSSQASSLLLSPPLKRSTGKVYLSPNRKNILDGNVIIDEKDKNIDNLKVLSYSELNIKNKCYFSEMPSLTTLYEETEDEDYTEKYDEHFGFSMNVKNSKNVTHIYKFGRSMNIMEFRKLKSKPMINIPKKISNNILRTFFDRNAEKRTYMIRSEERKLSKGWTNINRYSEKKVKPIPSGCWIQGKDDDKISNNIGSLKLITIKILNCPNVEEFNLGLHFEDLLLENFILVGGNSTFGFFTRDNIIFNELLSYLFKNSNGIKIPYIDEIVNFEVAL
ncbi:Hypothetical protein SRAE_X000067800 [Strongyloides ratti]|uniref:Uncharacterized protein n=1 Tax=Strongyloides ratti TaxID=34506 RepID=A0A090LNM0_STRRB|nr:Hypothetical protein SRAE_X000067800 [Strongyloides ratti]CEF71351.1 Hypothetical protein SRAE_X000067800 [Strongyloides ratti]